MSGVGDFIDATLRHEGSDDRAARERERLASDLRFYGASIGAIRGTVRDAVKRYPGLSRDDLTALSSELWSEPVYERRLAAVVLLQSILDQLDNSDLTRIEGFLRRADVAAIADPLTTDVVLPLIVALDPTHRVRADVIITRWSTDPNPHLRKAADALLRKARP